MNIRALDSVDAPVPSGGYAQAVEVRKPQRILYISGQIPVAKQGDAPAEFDAQCRLVWKNIEAQLHAAGMSFDNLVKVTTYLADRRHAAANSRIRREVLGERTPALTVIVTGIYDESWLLEIEAIGAD